PFEYGFTSPFVEGRASVLDRITRLGTYLDRDGQPITPFIYDKVVPFQHGLGLVMLDGKWGALDEDGEIVIVPQYDRIHLDDFPEYGFIYAKKDNKWGVINKDNEEIIPHKYDNLGHGGFKDGYMWAVENNQEGYINDKFEWTISPKKDRRFGGRSDEGLILVMENGKYGYMNEIGDTIIPFQYDDAAIFDSGLAPVRFNYGDPYYYFIDKTGKKIDSIKAYSVGEFVNGIADVGVEGNTSAYINTDFEKIFEGEYVIRRFEDKYATIQTMGDSPLYGLIDRKGTVIIEPSYEFLAYLENHDLVMFRENGLMGLMTVEQEVIHPATLNDIEFGIVGNHGLLLTYPSNGKEGYINNRGEVYYED
ncbi:MAG: WG repeat-containing protein, partial [Cyclobacteriaceae bacterium]